MPSKISLLSHHSTGMPSNLVAGLHLCQACNDRNKKRAPMGDTSDTIKLLPGTRLDLDFGFIRVSSLDFGTTAGHCSVTSYDGKNTFLIIVCAKARRTWVFCQPSKAPPIHIIECSLQVNCLEDGPRFMRMDQAGELW
jgi:hypothetical protein